MPRVASFIIVVVALLVLPGRFGSANGAEAPVAIRVGQKLSLELPAGDTATTHLTLRLGTASAGLMSVRAVSPDFEPRLEVLARGSESDAAPLGKRVESSGGRTVVFNAQAGGEYEFHLSSADFSDRGGAVDIEVQSVDSHKANDEPSSGQGKQYWKGVERTARREKNQVRLARALEQESLALSRDVITLQAGYPQEQARSIEGLMRESLRIRAELYGGDHPIVARTYYYFGTVSQDMHSLQAARSHYATARELYANSLGKDHPEVAKTVCGIASTFVPSSSGDDGDLSRASTLYRLGIGIYVQRHDPRYAVDFADALDKYGHVLDQVGEYEEAARAFETSMDIRKRYFQVYDRTVVETVLNLASVYGRIGRDDDAIELLERVLQWLRVGAPQEVDPKGARALHGGPNLQIVEELGSLYALAGLREKAIPYLDWAERSISIQSFAWRSRVMSAPFTPASTQETRWLRHLRYCEDDSTLSFLPPTPLNPGNFAGALPGFFGNGPSALPILAVGPPKYVRDPTWEFGLQEVSSVCWFRAAQRNWDEAKEERALDYATGLSKALAWQMRGAIAAVPERTAMRMVETRQHPENILFSGLVFGSSKRDAWLEACWNWTIRFRAVVLEEMASRHVTSLASESAETRATLERLAKARQRLASIWVGSPRSVNPDQSRAELKAAGRARDEAEATLARLSVRFRSEKKAREASFKEVAEALPSTAALVDFVRATVRPPQAQRSEDYFVALIIRGTDRKPAYAVLGKAVELDGLVQAWLDQLAASWQSGSIGVIDLSSVVETGSRLREKIWDPISAKIGSASLVFVVPDGALNFVNFGALPTREGRYLLEDGPALHLLSTSRDLVRLSAQSVETRSGVLALGDPDYTASRDARSVGMLGDGPPVFRGEIAKCPALSQSSWSRLVHSGEEVSAVAALFEGGPPVEVLTGAAASEERFKHDAPGKRVLHVATHGFFLRSRCETETSSARGMGMLVPAPDAGGVAQIADAAEANQPSSPIARLVPTDNPLLLSGLILAGANHAADAPADTDDGILTAEEIASLDLRGTEIATLSACESGLGTVEAGEGVFGLRRALEIAGVRTVVMSLWPVPDRETPLWMESFYRARLHGTSVVDAQREASRNALARLRAAGQPPHPYLWASFQAAGDWR